MQSNPFSPPLAVVDDVPLDDVVRKPISAWVLQVVIGVFLIVLPVLFVGSVVRTTSAPHPNWARIAMGSIIRIGAFVAMAQAVLGTQRRQARGRWWGLLFIGLLMGLVVFSSIQNVLRTPEAGLSSDVAYQAGEVVGGLGFMLLMLLLLAWWFRAFGFSPRARAWFVRATPS